MKHIIEKYLITWIILNSLMEIYTTKPIKELSPEEFRYLIKGKEILLSSHALWHLSQQQRKVFNVEDLLSMLLKETPRKAYLQENQRYAAYYRKSDGYRKLILELREDKSIIVTFIDVTEIPKYNI